MKGFVVSSQLLMRVILIKNILVSNKHQSIFRAQHKASGYRSFLQLVNLKLPTKSHSVSLKTGFGQKEMNLFLYCQPTQHQKKCDTFYKFYRQFYAKPILISFFT